MPSQVTTALSPPLPYDVLTLTTSDDAVIYVRRFGNLAGPRLYFSHGNGFAIDAYLPLWGHFLADHEVLIYDQRSHGWNPRHALGGHNELRMAEDMEALVQLVSDRFGVKPSIGIFHSLSSIVAILHARQFGRRFDHLILLDPPLLPPLGHALHSLALDFMYNLSRWAKQRPDEFFHWSDLAKSFRNSSRSRRWIDGAADQMAFAITRINNRGKYELICPREFEAKNYEENLNSLAWAYLKDLGNYISILSGDASLSDADPPCRVCRAAAREMQIEVSEIAMTGHMLFLERPETVAAEIRQILAKYPPILS